MNRLPLRKKVLSRRNWKIDTDAEALDEVNGALNDAVAHLAGDCPQAVIPSIEHVVLLPDRTHTSMVRTLAATSDPWVLSFGPVATAGAEAVTVDGTWDGLYHLEIVDSKGEKQRRVSREFFVKAIGDVVPVDHYCVSIDRPWPSAIETGMGFRMHAPFFYVTDDVVDIGHGDIYDDTGAFLETIPEFVVYALDRQDRMGRSVGRPEELYRGPFKQIQGPLITPQVAILGNATWAGPEPLGKFRVCFTYAAGRKDAARQSPRGEFDPVWESTPSPISASVTLNNAGQNLRIHGLPNIDHMQGFDPIPAALRNGKSGIRKRIYLVRDSVDTTGSFVDNIEVLGIPHYLTEVDGTTTETTWDGSIIPHYERRVPTDSHGYYAYAMVPHQDKRYEVDFSVRRKPRSLDHDGDAPTVHPTAMEALILLATFYAAQLDKQTAEADRYWQLYAGPPGNPELGALAKLQKNFGSPSKIIPGASWSANSLTGRTGRRRPFVPFKA